MAESSETSSDKNSTKTFKKYKFHRKNKKLESLRSQKVKEAQKAICLESIKSLSNCICMLLALFLDITPFTFIFSASLKHFCPGKPRCGRRECKPHSTADPWLASSHWLWPDLDAPGCCQYSDDLILIVLNLHFHSFGFMFIDII